MAEKVFVGFGDLTKARFLERPNRFVIRCRFEDTGEEVEAHLADPGRLRELLLPSVELYLRRAGHRNRKTEWSACLVQVPGSTNLVSLEPIMANRLTAKALEAKVISELARWDCKRAEYTHGKSRLDFYLEESQGNRLLLEVKSCTLVRDGIAMFPDAVTERGRRHVQKLSELSVSGEFETAVLFVVQRADAEIFRPAKHIDPAFASNLKIAHDNGVKLIVYSTLVDATGIAWGRKLPIDFS